MPEGPESRCGRMALITCCADTQGGWRKRRKKPLYKYGLSPGYCKKYRIPRASPTEWAFRDCFKSCGLIVCKHWNISAGICSVSSVNIVSACCHVSERQDTIESKRASSNQVITHCNTTCRNAGCVGPTADKTTPKIPRRTAHSSFSHNHDLASLLAFLLTIHALLTTTASNFTAQAAPSPSYLSTTSSRASARFNLVPVSQNTDSIFIYFNPPSILNLRVNTRQSVYFNFTLYPRQPRSNFTNNTTRTKKPPNDNILTSSPTQGIAHEPQREETASTSTTTSGNFTGSNQSHSIYSSSSLPSTSSYSTFANSTALPLQPKSLAHVSKKSDRNHSDESVYWVMIYSDDDSIARPVIISPNGLALAHADAKGSYILMAVWAGRIHNFSVEARHIGRVTMSVALLDVVDDRRMPQVSMCYCVW